MEKLWSDLYHERETMVIPTVIFSATLIVALIRKSPHFDSHI